MGFFNNLFDIDSRDNYAVTGLNKELNSLYIYNYFIKNKKNNLVITNSLYEANDVYNRLLNYTNKVLFFPMDDFITSEVTDISPEFVIDRLITLNKLLGSGKYIVVTNLMGILRYLPNTKLYKNKIIDINKNMDIGAEESCRCLQKKKKYSAPISIFLLISIILFLYNLVLGKYLSIPIEIEQQQYIYHYQVIYSK